MLFNVHQLLAGSCCFSLGTATATQQYNTMKGVKPDTDAAGGYLV